LKTTTEEVIKCFHYSTPKTQNYMHTHHRPIMEYYRPNITVKKTKNILHSNV